VNIIKSSVLSLLRSISPSIPLNLLTRITGQKLIFPFYHAISNTDILHIKHLYAIKSEKSFKQDLDYILKHYRPVNLEDSKRIIESNEVPLHNSFHLTFDDGLREIYEVVAPILYAKGIPATFFLNSAFVDNKDLFFRYKASLLLEALQNKKLTSAALEKAKSLFDNGKFKDLKELILSVNYKNKGILDQLAITFGIDYEAYLQKEKPYMDKDQIRDLMNKGFTVGAHSVDHPEFSTISLNDQIEQTKKSIDFINKEFKPDLRAFAFPFTDHNVSKEFFNCVFNPESPLADLTFGTAGIKHDNVERNIQRIPMESGDTAKSIITMQYLYYLCKFPFGKNTITRH
jgi:peptidoglycan/xylan/chitin deacetylase (PgdA/CDA1 family)